MTIKYTKMCEVQKVSEPGNVVPRNFLGLNFTESFQENIEA